MRPDIFTLMVMIASLSTILGIGLTVSRRILPDRTRSAAVLWGQSLLVMPAAMVLFASEGHLPTALTVVLAYVLVGIALGLRIDALRALVRSQLPHWLCYSALIAIVPVTIVLTYVDPQPRRRLAILTLIYAAQFLLGAWVTLGPAAARRMARQPGRWLMGAMFCLGASLLGARGSYLLLDPQAPSGLFERDPLNVAIFAFEALESVVVSCALLVMSCALVLERLQRANQRLSVAFEAAGLATWTVSPDALPELSDAEGTVFARPLAELLPRVHISERERIAGLAGLIGAPDAPIVRSEFRAIDPDNRLRWYSIFARVSPIGSRGRKELIVATRDIDLEKRAQIALNEAVRKLGSALDAVGMVSWEVDLVTDKVEFQGDIERLLGRPIATWAQLRACLSGEDVQMFDRECTKARSSNLVNRCEFRVMRPDGTVRIVMMQGAVIDEGAERGERMVGFMQDVSDQRSTEAALSVMQDYLRRALDAAGMVIWEWDVDSGERRSYGDDTALFGCRPRTTAEMDALIHPADAAATEEKFQASLRSGTDYVNEFRIVRPDGATRWLFTHGRPDRPVNGKVARISGVAWDITQRKSAESALVAAHDRLRLALEAAKMYVWEWDTATGERRHFGDDTQILGESPATGARADAMLHPDDRDRDLELFRHAVRAQTEYENEFRVLRRDGAVSWLHSRGRPVIDANGTSTLMAGVAIDITARRQAEATIRESERMRRIAGQAAGVNFWSYDLQTGARRGGDLDAAFFGRRIHSLTDFVAMLDPSDGARIAAAIDAVREGQEGITAEYRVPQSNGTYRWFSVVGQRFADGADGRAALVGVTREITDEHAHAEQMVNALYRERATSEAKTEFVASMSHEIRTPLNGVIGCVHMLTETALTARQTRLVQTMSHSAELLLSIINDILDFSKIEAGEMRLESIPFNLVECAESALDLVASQASAKALDLAVVVRGPMSVDVIGDPMRTQQIILNLLSNAIKFTEFGGIDVEIDIATAAVGDEFDARITVRDTGEGMSPEIRAGLFQPFRQGDVTTTRRHGGTGLGLAICHRLASKMGGTITVESAPGVGSTFVVSMKLKSVQTPAPSPNPWHGQRVWLALASSFLQRALHTQLNAWQAPALAAAPSAGQHWDVLVTDQAGWRSWPAVAAAIAASDPVRVVEVVPAGGWPIESTLAEDIVVSQLGLPLRASALRNALRNNSGAPVADAPTVNRGGIRDLDLRLLVAEDNPVNAVVLGMMLETLHNEAEFVGNGLEAVQRIESQEFDVVMLDIEMPFMDGLDAARAIRRARPDTGLPWIIAITAHVMADSRARILAAGMNDYIAKPIQLDELRGALLRAGQFVAAQSAIRATPEA